MQASGGNSIRVPALRFDPAWDSEHMAHEAVAASRDDFEPRARRPASVPGSSSAGSNRLDDPSIVTEQTLRYIDAEGIVQQVSLATVQKLAPPEGPKLSCTVACPGGRRLAVREKLCCMFSFLVVCGLIAMALTMAMLEKERPTRHYFLAIEEVEWDYTPGGMNNCTGKPFGYPETKYTQAGETRIGSKYTKAVYREFTDASFLVPKPRAAKWQHLGLLGPAIHAEVGDLVKVTVRNNARYTFSFSAQSAGTNKANEGARYRADPHTPGWTRYDDALPPLSLTVRDCGTPMGFMSWALGTLGTWSRVQPGKPHSNSLSRNQQDRCANYDVNAAEARTYEFLVDESAGPSDSDSSSILHLYMSHVGNNSMTLRQGGYDGFGPDSSAGLVGPLIITRRGSANEHGEPNDVERELVVLMGVQDENDSPYLRKNVWDRIVAKQFGDDRPPGHLPFGPVSKEAALQGLYTVASRTGDKLSFAEAERLIRKANAAKTYVGTVRGVQLRIWFDKLYFEPRWYDANNGGMNTALTVMESLWKESVDVNDPAFRESNMMHSVNGYLYCTQPGLDMRAGQRVRWHMASVGGTDAVHTPHWHGNTVLGSGGRGDQLNLLASSTQSVDMDAESSGSWMLHCHVNDHKKSGMISLYHVEPADPPAPTTCSAPVSSSSTEPGPRLRTYYIQAEEVEWSYYDPVDAAQGIDRCAGDAPFSSQFGHYARRATEANGEDRIGVTFTKARYLQYTDATFRHRMPAQPWEGVLGPTLRGAVGDTIVVVARNTLPYNISVHAHGVQYTKGNEGAPYNDGTSGADKADDSIRPGGQHHYVYCVPESAGPGPEDGSSIVWLYHDHVHEVNGTNSGLIGSIIITAAERATAAAIPTDVDQEFVLLFAAFDENIALHAATNVARRLPRFEGNTPNLSQTARDRLTYKLRKFDGQFGDSMRKWSINGYMQCALPGLTWAAGARVRLHMIAMGDEELHTPTLVGHTLLHRGRRQGSVGLMASTMKSVDLRGQGHGKMLLRSYASGGADRGMMALAHVTGSADARAASSGGEDGTAPTAEDGADASSGRTYYISADEVEWDFLPQGQNLCKDKTPFRARTTHGEGARAGGYQGLAGTGFNRWADNGLETEYSLYTDAEASPHRIGTRYVVALYREYEDESFEKLKHGFRSRSNSVSAHLGMQGPLLRAVVGEKVTIVLRNQLRYAMNFALSGVRAAGGPGAERPLLPGEVRSITYIVDEGAAPTHSSSIAYSYTSDFHVAATAQAAYDEAQGVGPTTIPRFADFSAGLFGALVVTSGAVDRLIDDAPADVQREFVLFMGVLDQNRSPYLELNINQFAAAPESVDRRHPEFKESNRMHAINGRVYCNLEGLEILYGRTARYYVFSLGSSDAMASPRWYGHSPLVGGRRVGAPLVQPGMGIVADVLHSNRGIWLFEDQTSSHAHAGCAALFKVPERVTSICEVSFWSKC